MSDHRAWEHPRPDRGRSLLAGAAVALCAAMLAGCGSVVSLQPPYLASDLVVDDTLAGTWVFAEWQWEDTPTFTIDETTTWTFGAPRSGAFDLTIASETGAILAVARLFRIGPHLFLDLHPSPEVTSTYPGLVIPVHLTFTVLRSRDAIMLKQLSANRLGDRLRRGDLNLRYIAHRDDIILTGSTKEVRDLFLLHAADPGIFEDRILLVRKP